MKLEFLMLIKILSTINGISYFTFNDDSETEFQTFSGPFADDISDLTSQIGSLEIFEYSIYFFIKWPGPERRRECVMCEQSSRELAPVGDMEEKWKPFKFSRFPPTLITIHPHDSQR